MIFVTISYNLRNEFNEKPIIKQYPNHTREVTVVGRQGHYTIVIAWHCDGCKAMSNARNEFELPKKDEPRLVSLPPLPGGWGRHSGWIVCARCLKSYRNFEAPLEAPEDK